MAGVTAIPSYGVDSCLKAACRTETATGRSGVDGSTDANTTIRTQSGKDDVVAATPGPITIDTGIGPDSVEAGGVGRDIMDVVGTTARESLAVSAQSGHLLLTHDGRPKLDSLGVEQLVYQSHGGPRPGSAR